MWMKFFYVIFLLGRIFLEDQSNFVISLFYDAQLNKREILSGCIMELFACIQVEFDWKLKGA